jgi:hypothetical protein
VKSCHADLIAKTKNIDISDAMDIAVREIISGTDTGIHVTKHKMQLRIYILKH